MIPPPLADSTDSTPAPVTRSFSNVRSPFVVVIERSPPTDESESVTLKPWSATNVASPPAATLTTVILPRSALTDTASPAVIDCTTMSPSVADISTSPADERTALTSVTPSPARSVMLSSASIDEVTMLVSATAAAPSPSPVSVTATRLPDG